MSCSFFRNQAALVGNGLSDIQKFLRVDGWYLMQKLS
jgi:hypothetical protein